MKWDKCMNKFFPVTETYVYYIFIINQDKLSHEQRKVNYKLQFFT